MGYGNSMLSMYEMPQPLSAPSTTAGKVAGVADGAERFNKGKCWNIPGVSPMLWLQTQGGADWLRDMLVGPPEERKAALDAILAVQTSEYLTLSQLHHAAILQNCNGDPASIQHLLPGKYKADNHLLRLVELHAKLSAPRPRRHREPLRGIHNDRGDAPDTTQGRHAQTRPIRMRDASRRGKAADVDP